MKGKKVAVGLSGGVDSSVSAALLIEQGYEVTGVYLTCWSGSGCRSEEDRQDALDIALSLEIPFVHLDFQKEYKEKVYEYMILEYQAGRTPNPDVVCNREIKFGLFYEWAMEQGFDFVATGHYARITPGVKVPDGRNTPGVVLSRSVDEHKDQTYFLYQLRGEQLEHILFPIGHMLKSEVRLEAERRDLLTAKKPDSVGICFIGEKPMTEFLKQRIEEHEGEIRLTTTSTPHFDYAGPLSAQSRDADATQNVPSAVVGKHKGIQFYTIGQKIAVDHNKIKGFDTTNLPYFYVISKDVEKNILYVGIKEQLAMSELTMSEIHWISGKPDLNDCLVRIRHCGELVPAILEDNKLLLKKSVNGVAPGQSVVLYQGEVCLGGGIIVS